MTRRLPLGLPVLVAVALATAGCGSSPDRDSLPVQVGVDDTGGTAAGGAVVTTLVGPDGETRSVVVGRASIRPDGNRVAVGVGAIDRVEPIDVELPGVPVQVLPVRGGWSVPFGSGSFGDEGDGDGPFAGEPAPRWFVTLDDGTGVVVDETFAVVDGVLAEPLPSVDGFDEPLPDGIVALSDDFAVALVQPTDRYPHGALGDRIEAAAVQVLGFAGDTRTTFGPEPPAVIEGISALVGDATGDGRPEILVTHSDADQGASLALWSPDGELLATSQGIGLGNRWRNQLAIAPVGPGGEIEIIDVRTPHIGGTVQYFRVEGDRLVLVASHSGFTSHRLGSRNLDLGIVADANGDGVLDVVVPTDRRETIGVLTRFAGASVDDGVEISAEVDLPGRMTTNIGVRPEPDGQPEAGAATTPTGLGFAIGTEDGVLRIWPAPDPADR